MSLALHMSLALVAGFGLGLLYFAGLWLTVRRVVGRARPGLWLAASFAVRLGLLGGGMTAVAAGRWEALLAALGGFFVARLCVVRVVRRPPAGDHRCA